MNKNTLVKVIRSLIMAILNAAATMAFIAGIVLIVVMVLSIAYWTYTTIMYSTENTSLATVAAFGLLAFIGLVVFFFVENLKQY